MRGRKISVLLADLLYTQGMALLVQIRRTPDRTDPEHTARGAALAATIQEFAVAQKVFTEVGTTVTTSEEDELYPDLQDDMVAAVFQTFNMWMTLMRTVCGQVRRSRVY